MTSLYRAGDLVHIPQSTSLLDCTIDANAQLSLPRRVEQTKAPTIGVVIHHGENYVQIYCDGDRWSVADKSIYLLDEGK